MNDPDRRRRLEALFHAHAAAVRAYAARRADVGAADDITSDVFVIAWRRLDDVPEDALPWAAGLRAAGGRQPVARDPAPDGAARAAEPGASADR